MAASKMTNSHEAGLATSRRPIRVLVAGAGAFGREHLSRLIKRPDVKVAGAADANPAALDPIRAGFGVEECLTDPLRLIDAVEADAIIIATPGVSHVEIGVRALERNLAVLLEKPVAPSASAAALLLAAARRSTGFVMPGHVLRFSQDHMRMVETVRSGAIGEVIYVNSRRYRDDSHAVRYPDDDPVLMTLHSRHRHCPVGYRFGLPFGCGPPLRRRWLPIDDSGVGDHGDRGHLRPADGLDIHERRVAA